MDNNQNDTNLNGGNIAFFDIRIVPFLLVLNFLFIANLILHLGGTLYLEIFKLTALEEIIVYDARMMGGLPNHAGPPLNQMYSGRTLAGLTDKQALLGAEFVFTLKVFVSVALAFYTIAWIREARYRSATGHARISNPVLSNGLLGFISTNFVVVFFVITNVTTLSNFSSFSLYLKLENGTLRNIAPAIFTLVSLNMSFILLFNPSALQRRA